MTKTLEAEYPKVVEGFSKIGADVRIGYPRWGDHIVRVSVQRRRTGERHRMFSIHVPGTASKLSVLDVQPEQRHLLLEARDFWRPLGKSLMLCGHDERNWFVAAIPEKAHATTVEEAKDALLPKAVKDALGTAHFPRFLHHTRRNRVFKRQGEWFFLPRPDMTVKPVALNEPIRRGAARPHMCQEVYRLGGERVKFHPIHAPNGIMEGEFVALSFKKRQDTGWQNRYVDMKVFVRGTVTHPDHRTLTLPFWHEVIQNREVESRAMRNVAFVD